ncbi:hypothetical protein H0X48_06455 [Candidatus Dependentiae bacterium]|nr:hypothetical protein [Candidatus Dependentiae bacterium]
MYFSKRVLSTFIWLLKADISVFKKEYVGKVIDTGIWVIINIVITSYILPSLGIPSSFGLLLVAGLVASAGLMEVYPNTMSLAADLKGDQTITYSLTLPLPSWLVPIKIATYFALTAASIGIWVLPLAKLLLFNQLSLAAVSWSKLALIFLLSNMFSGVFALFLGTMIKDIATDHTWMRFVFPLWFLGGFQFTWQALYAFSPVLAYLDLLNPFLWIMEGTRISILGQEGNLPFGLCILALVLFIFIIGYMGISRLRKKLDFV